jgi:hypothetical protein
MQTELRLLNHKSSTRSALIAEQLRAEIRRAQIDTAMHPLGTEVERAGSNRDGQGSTRPDKFDFQKRMLILGGYISDSDR